MGIADPASDTATGAVNDPMGFFDKLKESVRGYAMGTGPVREQMMNVAQQLSQDKPFGAQVGTIVGQKLKGSNITDLLANKINTSVGGWIQQNVPDWMQGEYGTGLLFKQSSDAQFGYQLGKRIAGQGTPFSQGAASQVASTAITPGAAIDVIGKTQFSDPVKAMMKFMMTGNLGSKGLLGDIFGQEFMGLLGGSEGASDMPGTEKSNPSAPGQPG